jgi:structural maintenance of chromosome 4
MPPKMSKVDDGDDQGQGQNGVVEENALDVSEIREEEETSEDEEGGLRIGDIYIPPPPNPVCSNETTGPRLIITHIVNEYFKSYAGKQVLGPFHKVLGVVLTFPCIVFINLSVSLCHVDQACSTRRP